MEKRTIGGFIAALRRAGGMTQRELADRLNVSDKTVSRWERDEGAPDLSLIPVIAEIFGVTCDELLRGERRSPSQSLTLPEDDAPSTRGERERLRLLRAALSRYKGRTYVSMGVSVAGLLTALVCNFAFLKALLGFYLGAAFIAAGVVCQAVFINLAIASVDGAGLSDMELSDFRRGVCRWAQLSFGLAAALLGFTAPLLAADANMGITSGLARYGLISAALALAVFGAVCFFLNAHFVKTGIFILGEDGVRVYRRNHKLLGSCAAGLAAALILTAAADSFLTDGVDIYLKGTVFNDYESFKEFMERDVDYYGRQDAASESVVPPSPDGLDGGGDSGVIRSKITDKDGNVVCEYIRRNDSVSRISYGENTLPITVYTYQDFDRAYAALNTVNAVFYALYCLELAAAAFIYLTRRSRPLPPT